jgi:ribosomal protein S18 acetylase RimI-like enzyme
MADGISMTNSEPRHTIRTASRDDWRNVAAITAEAFSDDPVNRWLFGTERALAVVFGTLARDSYLKSGVCHLIDDRGATMWRKVDGPHQTVGVLSVMRIAAGLLRHGSPGSVKRAIAAGEIIDANHPREPHIYLFTIGTRKAARGKGLGKALLQPVLASCDRDSLPVYLENSNPANTGFYMHHGFRRTKLFEVGPGSPPLEAMWREPGAGNM